MPTTSALRPARTSRPRLTVRGLLEASPPPTRTYRLRQQLGGARRPPAARHRPDARRVAAELRRPR